MITMSVPPTNPFFFDQVTTSNELHLEQDFQRLRSLYNEDNAIKQRSFNVSIGAQPALYQIAHYNVHPIPCISFEQPLTHDETIHIELIVQSLQATIATGFLKGDVKLAKAGSTKIYFPGLKLNKKGAIKSALRALKIEKAENYFQIKFQIRQTVLISNPFKLVSNYNQLPEDHKPNIRPPRRKVGTSTTTTTTTSTTTISTTYNQEFNSDSSPTHVTCYDSNRMDSPGGLSHSSSSESIFLPPGMFVPVPIVPNRNSNSPSVTNIDSSTPTHDLPQRNTSKSSLQFILN